MIKTSLGGLLILAGLVLMLFCAKPAFLVYADASATAATSVNITICGNGIVEAGEFCDDDGDNKTYVSGTGERYCNMACSGWAPACGDAIVQSEFGEICDGSGGSCAIGGYAGIKDCNSSCDGWLECRATEYCGDGQTNGAEQCDGGTQSCAVNGYAGARSCMGDCSGWSDCVVTENCGDGQTNGAEQCDGGTQSCAVNGYVGTQSCNNTCSGWQDCVISEFCGDNIKNGAEQCDGEPNCTNNCQLIFEGRNTSGGWAPQTKIVLQGTAYPLSMVTVLKNGRPITAARSDGGGNFRIETANIAPGIWTLGLRADDAENVRSSALNLTINVNRNITTTVTGIILPPTIKLDKTSSAKGGIIRISGQSAPMSDISININPSWSGLHPTAKTNESGSWFYLLDTDNLSKGIYTVHAKNDLSGHTSTNYSKIITFSVGEKADLCAKSADLDANGAVNNIDFSIFLSNWENQNSGRADINCDGTADMVDFSIMMYQWTG